MDKNSQSFTPEEVSKGMVNELVGFLLNQNTQLEGSYNEIRITSDGYCTIVEWATVPYDGEWGGKFQFIDVDHEVFKEVIFPDNHYEYLRDNEEEEAIKEWLEENPGWKKNDYGIWVNEEENERIRKELLGEKD